MRATLANTNPVGHTPGLQGLHHATIPQGGRVALIRHRVRCKGRPGSRLQAARGRRQGEARARLQRHSSAEGLQGQAFLNEFLNYRQLPGQ